MERQYSIEEVLAECNLIQRNPYTYDFSRFPVGVCGGHTIGAYPRSLAAVLIDNTIVNMGVINERYPNGHIVFDVCGKTMTGSEYVRYRLERR